MITKLKKHLEPLIAIIAYPFLSWNPSVITVLSLLAAALFFVGIVQHMYFLSFVSLVGFLFDAIDGYVARHQNKVTAFGGFLDSTLDRAADFLFITSFAYAHLVSWEIAVLVLFTSFLISYMRSRGDLAFDLGHAPADGLMQRTERIIFIYLAFLFYIFLPNVTIGSLSILSAMFLLICGLNIYTIFQRLLLFSQMEK